MDYKGHLGGILPLLSPFEFSVLSVLLVSKFR